MRALLACLAVATAATAAFGQCTIQATGQRLLPAPIDSWTTSIPIGFPFVFQGQVYTHLYVSDHSLVSLHDGSQPAPAGGSALWNPDPAFLVSGGPMIAAYWSDHTVGTVGGIWVDNSSGHYCTVTWVDHQTYSQQTPPFTVQLTLFQDSRVVVCFDGRVPQQGSSFGALNAIVGVSSGASNSVSASVDLTSSSPPSTSSGLIYEEFTTSAQGVPNPNFDLRDQVVNFSPQAPGWSIVVVPIGCASYNHYGHGCNGLTIDSNAPVIGESWDITMAGMPSTIGLLFFGTQPLYPGISMSTFGINTVSTCHNFLGDLINSVNLVGVSGGASYSLPVPANPGLKGSWLVVQGLSLTADLSLFLTSNGLAGIFGY